MSEGMTIEQVREERRILAEQIKGAVKAFNEKTGVSVEYVNLQYVDIAPVGEISRKLLASVEVDLNI